MSRSFLVDSIIGKSDQDRSPAFTQSNALLPSQLHSYLLSNQIQTIATTPVPFPRIPLNPSALIHRDLLAAYPGHYSKIQQPRICASSPHSTQCNVQQCLHCPPVTSHQDFDVASRLTSSVRHPCATLDGSPQGPLRQLGAMIPKLEQSSLDMRKSNFAANVVFPVHMDSGSKTQQVPRYNKGKALNYLVRLGTLCRVI